MEKEGKLNGEERLKAGGGQEGGPGAQQGMSVPLHVCPEAG